MPSRWAPRLMWPDLSATFRPPVPSLSIRRMRKAHVPYSRNCELHTGWWSTSRRLGRIGLSGGGWAASARFLTILGIPGRRTCRPITRNVCERMQLSLDGLGIGDALGQMLSYRAADAPRRLAENQLPPGPWLHTDDTEMAISIAAVLKWHGELDQDALAKRFARRFQRDPDRGYGSTTRRQLEEINAGRTWQDMSINAFGGRGSMGNGGAMRVAPLGAYFANDLGACAAAACASAFVTHTHPEGIAGTIAVAIAAAMAWQLRNASWRRFRREVLR